MTEKRISSSSEKTITKILDATIKTISKQGLTNLSMSSVCRVASISRGTLYRYFPSKEILLERLGERTRQDTEDGLKAAVAQCSTGQEMLKAIIKTLDALQDQSKGTQVLDAEPAFFISFLRRNLPHYSALITEILNPFYDELEQQFGHKINRTEYSELILRLQTSYVFLPKKLTNASTNISEKTSNIINILTARDSHPAE